MAPADKDHFSKKETSDRIEKALRAALTTPPKTHDDMKIGRPKASPKKKATKR